MVRRWSCSLLIILLIERSFHAYFAQDFRRSQRIPPVKTEQANATQDHLGLASHFLENGDRGKACSHFRQYLLRHPLQWDVRAFYSEVLLKDGRTIEAQTEIRRFLADAQSDPLAMPNQRIQGHQLLMEIAVLQKDVYEFHLQRGLALYWLAQARRSLGNVHGEFSVEGLLIKVKDEMLQAHRLAPNRARPCWYLSRVWQTLGRSNLARQWFEKAQRLAVFSQLTTTERVQLSLCQRDSYPAMPR